MWVPPTEKKKNKNTKREIERKDQTERQLGKKEIFFLNFLSLFLSQIPEFLTVGFWRDKHEKCSTRRGLRVSTKNTGYHREFR